jgi:hypothetical protein
VLLVMAAALLAAVFVASCGGDDERRGGTFGVTGDADQYAGPTPLISRFTASAKNPKGEVAYRWRFDDGTTSEEQNPTHTFPRAGYYTVILDARDENGDNDRQTFLLGVWPRSQWAEGQETGLTRERAKAAQREQQQRTDVRHREIRQRVLKRAREQTQG